MLSYILSFFPKTGPYFEKRCHLKELKHLSEDWEPTCDNVKNAQSIMKKFVKAIDDMNIQAEDQIITLRGYRSAEDVIKSYIGDETADRLIKVAGDCITHATIEDLRLQDVKKILLKWDDDDEAYKILKHYVKTLRTFDEDENVEEFVEEYLGEELYERLGTMIRFYERFENLKRTLNRTW
jgi:hypothetical protein